MKNIYVVLGMARSGTSVIARALKALGVELGTQFAVPHDKWNPTGFWEDKDIVYKINRGVLYALQQHWMSVRLCDELDLSHKDIQKMKAKAVELLQTRMKTVNEWGFKDPRTAKLLPFWQEVFTALNAKAHYIIVLRHPLAAAFSYQHLTGTSVEVGLMLWLMHMVPSVDHTKHQHRMIVSYERMLTAPKKELARMQKTLLFPSQSKEEINDFTNTFLQGSLQHFQFEKSHLNHPALKVVPLAEKVHHLLSQVAEDQLSFTSDIFMNEWAEIKADFLATYPLYEFIDSLLQDNKHLTQLIHKMKKSLPWKLIYPLRVIDDILRGKRRKAREKRRLIKAYV